MLFDLPSLGKRTGKREMSPKHQHWNSFDGKALGWFCCAKTCTFLHPQAPRSDLNVTEYPSWEASVLIPGHLANIFLRKFKTLFFILKWPHSFWMGPQFSQHFCCTCILHSPTRGEARSTNDYCKQDYLPTISSMFSRSFITTSP